MPARLPACASLGKAPKGPFVRGMGQSSRGRGRGRRSRSALEPGQVQHHASLWPSCVACCAEEAKLWTRGHEGKGNGKQAARPLASGRGPDHHHFIDPAALAASARAGWLAGGPPPAAFSRHSQDAPGQTA
ncbi:uncharacterized protein PSFLO_05762 [Pseudozyma flocculosa]|uniref:Uncharacterized protein n=1 Tax=Pseudozyma flocculosa TaxID=84751 RepID=A0A5C3F7V7_9BASI|nr:uncharacterized protein PSFLO_05762 [Pseudozyma flocculosa]